VLNFSKLRMGAFSSSSDAVTATKIFEENKKACKEAVQEMDRGTTVTCTGMSEMTLREILYGSFKGRQFSYNTDMNRSGRVWNVILEK
jgi:hypothetical protein